MIKTKTKFNIIILISLILSIINISNSNAKIIRLPYLQSVTDKLAVIMVESDDTNPIWVIYNELGNSISLEAKTEFYVETENSKLDNSKAYKTFVHRIILNNLKPNTMFHYKIKCNNSTVNKTSNETTNDISDKLSEKICSPYTFITSSKDIGNFKFVVMGDSRSGAKIFNKIANGMAKQNPHFAIYLGDLAYKKDYEYWEDEFFIENNEKFICNVPFYNAVGNHEGWNQNTKAFTQSVIISNPKDKHSKDKHSNDNKPYYSYDWGNIHFLNLSTENTISKNSEQYQFAVEDLKKSKAKWKIVSFHIPAYSVGAHGENKNMKNFTANVLEPAKIDMVLTGHSHYYQHNKINGISHFVFGGGGSPLYTPKSKEYTLKSEKKYHFALFDVTNDKITIKVIDKDENIIDTIIFKK